MIRVLLIDNALRSRNSIHEKLNAAGTCDLNVHRVTCYSEMLHALRQQSYDVCILDSLDNGAAFFAELRSLSFSVPIVMVVSDSAEVALEAMRNGVADCLIRDELSVSQIEQTVCDVAERSRYYSVQSHRERRLLALLDNAADFVYTHDLKGNFTSINRAGERLTGYEEAEILTMNVGQILMPGYQSMVWRTIDRALDAQTQVAEEIELCTKAGSPRLVEISIHPIQHLGKTIEIQGVARPIAKGRYEDSPIPRQRAATSLVSEHRILAMPDYQANISSPLFSA